MFKRLLLISVPLAIIFLFARLGQKVAYVERHKENTRVEQNPNLSISKQLSSETEKQRRASIEDELAKLEIRSKLNAPNAFIISQNDYSYYRTLSGQDTAIIMKHYRKILMSDGDKNEIIEIRLDVGTLKISTSEDFDEWVYTNFSILAEKDLYP